MKKGQTRILNIVILIAILAISVLYGNHRLEKQRTVMQKDIDKSVQKAEMLQRRYAEQKAISDRLQRMQVSLEGQKNTIQAELTKTKDEYALLQKEFDEIKEKKLSVCEENYAKLSSDNKELKERLKEEQALFNKTRKENETALATLRTESETKISELNIALKSLQSRMGSCINKNARLSVIADELIMRYEDKGVMSAIMSREPITQIEKVELEEIAQEYRDEIKKLKENKNINIP